MIHQYHINFNKGEDKLTRLERQMQIGRWLVLLLFVILLGTVTWFTQKYYAQLSDLISSKQKQLEDVRAEIRRLRETGTQISREDIMKLNKLEQSRLLWARKLQELGREASGRIALTGAKYEKGLFTINGAVKIVENREPIFDVMDFVDNLESNPEFNRNFASIKFRSSEKSLVGEEEILEFEVVCEARNEFKPKAFRTREKSPKVD